VLVLVGGGGVPANIAGIAPVLGLLVVLLRCVKTIAWLRIAARHFARVE
jgi:hypothetical protein